jgi:T-complex protein 1 subunit delta
MNISLLLLFSTATTMSGEQMQGNERKRDVRLSNIIAGKAVADVISTSLGPKGMDKLITSSSGEVVISNDGATILNKIEKFRALQDGLIYVGLPVSVFRLS